MDHFFAYIRVSTTRQGEQGVSLQQQKDAIARYAERNGLKIVLWFEEMETAAKAGRPVFGRTVRLLRRRKAAGVIIHKIDRSARNLRDWADLGELIDHGIDVHFANESLDLRSRGGRLSADIQAVLAADFVRDLRDKPRRAFGAGSSRACIPCRPRSGIYAHCQRSDQTTARGGPGARARQAVRCSSP